MARATVTGWMPPYNGVSVSGAYFEFVVTIGNASQVELAVDPAGYASIGDLQEVQEDMVDVAVAAGNTKAVNYNFGDGAIHSSSTKEHVATSKFKDKSINDGWNLCGLWNRIDFGDKINSILKGGAEEDEPIAPDPVEPEPAQEVFATVWAKSGDTVNIRKEKNTHSKLVERVPIGATVRVIKQGNEWSKVCYTDKAGAKWYGYMMSEFLKNESCVGSGEGDTVVVCIPFLTRYQAEALIAQYPGAWIENAVG